MEDDLNSQIIKESKILETVDKEAAGLEKALREYLTAAQELSIVGQQLSHEIKRMGEKLPDNEWAQATVRLGDCQLLLEKLRMEHLEKALENTVIEPWKKQRRDDETQLAETQRKIKLVVRRLESDSNKRKTQSLNKQASKASLLHLVEEERRVSLVKGDLLKYCRTLGQQRFARWLQLNVGVLSALQSHHSAAFQKLGELEPVIQLVNQRHFVNFNLPALFDEKSIPADGLAPKQEAAHRLSTHFDAALGGMTSGSSKSSSSHRSLAGPMSAPPQTEMAPLASQPSRLSVQVTASTGSITFSGSNSLGPPPKMTLPSGAVPVLPQPTPLNMTQPLKPVPKTTSTSGMMSPRSVAPMAPIAPPTSLPPQPASREALPAPPIAPPPAVPSSVSAPVTSAVPIIISTPPPPTQQQLDTVTKERDLLSTRQRMAKDAIRALQSRLGSLSQPQLSHELDSIISLLDKGEPLRKSPSSMRRAAPAPPQPTVESGAGMSSLDSVEQSIEQILAGLGRAAGSDKQPKPEKPKMSASASLDEELAALMGKS